MKKNLKGLRLTKKTISDLQALNVKGAIAAHSAGTDCHTNSCGTRCRACKETTVYTIVC
ncbi:hypothetical protein [Kordia zhangzhouensis]|uniref:hypothetical protein n=1 Tax=Kordia zhangzhouensis TaxID=1620405 RepID=UPI0012FCE3AE|nr:hypothetical protein [Kordia zhangzhouensis]